MSRKLALSISLWLVAALRGWAQEEPIVLLSTDRAVYALEDLAPVKITIQNLGPGDVNLIEPSPCTIWKDGKKIYTFSSVNDDWIEEGQSRSWSWNRKTAAGQAVGAGNYEIHVGQFWKNDWDFDLGLAIAILPTGKVAGSNLFPLTAGNEWRYALSPEGDRLTMKASAKPGNWTKLSWLAGAQRLVTLKGSTLSARVNFLPNSPVVPLFRFKLALGATYSVNLGPSLLKVKLKVTSLNETVTTFAGTFPGCYRLEVLPSTGLGYRSFFFAPGIGLVRFDRVTSGGPESWQLNHAKLKGSDGKGYLIGLN